MSTNQSNNNENSNKTGNKNVHVDRALERDERLQEDKIEATPEFTPPANFPKSRQSYAARREARKAAEPARPNTIDNQSQILRAKRKAKDVHGFDGNTSGATHEDGPTNTITPCGFTVEDAGDSPKLNGPIKSSLMRGLRRTREEREAKDAIRRNDIAPIHTTAGLSPLRGLSKNRNAALHALRHRTQIEEEAEVLAEEDTLRDLEAPPLQPPLEMALAPPLHPSPVVTEGAASPEGPPHMTASVCGNTAPMVVSPDESSEQSPVLLEARLVNEPDLVHAQQVQFTVKSEDTGDEEDTNKFAQRMYSAGMVTLVVTIGILVGILMAASNNSEGNTLPPPTASTQVASISPQTVSFLPTFTLETIAKEYNSPQAMALSWLQRHPDFHIMTLWRKQQLMALSTLYYSTGGEDSWRRLWLKAGIMECEWHEESNCTKDGRYQGLQLQESGLKGTIPPEVALVSGLTRLSFQDNQLEGSLPVNLSHLTALTSLDLQRNAFTGSLPSEIGKLTALAHLGCHENAFTGAIPSELGQLTALTKLPLNGNQLTGTVASSLGHMTSLLGLYFYDNDLSGQIPAGLGQLTSLTDLELQRNAFTGTLPLELGQLTALRHLGCHENMFNGVISSELGQLTALTHLALGDNWLTSSIPSSLAELTSLGELRLQNNDLSGVVPSGICGLANMTSLWVDCDLLDCTCVQCTCNGNAYESPMIDRPLLPLP